MTSFSFVTLVKLHDAVVNDVGELQESWQYVDIYDLILITKYTLIGLYIYKASAL